MFTNWRRFLFVSINASVKVAASMTNTILHRTGYIEIDKVNIVG